MRAYLDVGAYDGGSTRQAIRLGFPFDHFYCFEPQMDLCTFIRAIDDPRVVVCPYGLWNKTTLQEMYVVKRGKRTGASVYIDKHQARAVKTVLANFVRASDWFRDHVADDDQIVMKINVEGAECDILDDLIESGEYRKIGGLAVAFDVRKVPSQAHREAEMRERITRLIPKVFVLEERECYRLTRRHGSDAFLRYWMEQVL